MEVVYLLAYYGTKISPHIDRSPEGYLICRDVPINRTGVQDYLAGELGLGGDPERVVKVYRLPEDVFAPAALASFEGKDVSLGHPPEMLTAENQSAYSKGHLEHVRRVGDNTVADLFIKDPVLASQVESGAMREVSCGYNCKFEPYLDGYRQTNIIGNHLAVVPRGRAGKDVAIRDTAAQAEKGTLNMNFWKSFWAGMFGAAADADLDVTPAMTAQAVQDAEPAEPAQDAEPAAASQQPAEPAASAQDASSDALAALGDRMGKLEAMLAQLLPKEKPEHMSDETDIDELIEKLAGEGGESALTIQVENTDACAAGPARDAAVELLRKVRPAVAEIKDKAERARVTDALLSAVKGPDSMAAIAQAATDAAKANAGKTAENTYEKMCVASLEAYAALNPHTKPKKED